VVEVAEQQRVGDEAALSPTTTGILPSSPGQCHDVVEDRRLRDDRTDDLDELEDRRRG
jgi:hypothetical protein